MTITISPEIEAKAREKAAAEGVSVETYVARLIREDGWLALEGEAADDRGSEFSEIRTAVMEGLEQVERGEGRPAREFFAELRAKHGVSR